MNFRFAGKKITSLVTVLPKQEFLFDDEMAELGFAPAKSAKLKQVMGFDKHRIAESDTCASDLCMHGLQHLFDTGVLDRADVGALLFVSQSPDRLIPPTSNLLQGRAGLGRDVFCMDINQGCAGFVVGLVQAFMMLETLGLRKVVLLNGDTLSKKVSRRDRNIYPMIGDAGSVAVIENDPGGGPIHGCLQMDGSRGEVLMIPAGGARLPSTPETATERDAGDGNLRSQDHFYMNGAEVFNFVQVEVPPLIGQLLDASGESKDGIDVFLFHQPNRFMLEKLADRLKVDRAKIPNNVVEHFGNASSVTIPTAIALNLGACLKQKCFRVCLGGFGVGLTIAALVMDLGPMQTCELLEM